MCHNRHFPAEGTSCHLCVFPNGTHHHLPSSLPQITCLLPTNCPTNGSYTWVIVLGFASGDLDSEPFYQLCICPANHYAEQFHSVHQSFSEHPLLAFFSLCPCWLCLLTWMLGFCSPWVSSYSAAGPFKCLCWLPLIVLAMVLTAREIIQVTQRKGPTLQKEPELIHHCC